VSVLPGEGASFKMVKPLNEFGGWLKFFYFYLWARLITGLVVMLGFLSKLFSRTSSSPSALDWLYSIESFVLFFLYIILLRIIKKPDSKALNKISKLLILCGFIGVLFCFAKPFVEFANNQHYVSFGSIIEWIWVLPFISYLRQSKRVKAYYGVNAFEKLWNIRPF